MRVVIADDHPMMVEALRAALTEVGLEVVGATAYGAEVVGLVERTRPDVVVLDLQMPDRSGFECLAALRAAAPEVKVIILSGSEDRASIDRALALGAVCYAGKSVDPRDLAATVRSIATGSIHVLGSVVGAAAREPADLSSPGVEPRLTGKEHEILQLVATGMPTGQVARKLWVTQATVKFHLSNIYRKLEVSNRTQATAKAHKLGLVTFGASTAVAEDTPSLSSAS